MSRHTDIPLYAADGTPLGFRSAVAAERLLANGAATPSYGRKGRLRALWLCKPDGSNPVETTARRGTRYSFLETLESGRCWSFRRLDERGDDGRRVDARDAFQQVILDCLRA